jgi:hypothetical protein
MVREFPEGARVDALDEVFEWIVITVGPEATLPLAKPLKELHGEPFALSGILGAYAERGASKQVDALLKLSKPQHVAVRTGNAAVGLADSLSRQGKCPDAIERALLAPKAHTRLGALATVARRCPIQ